MFFIIILVIGVIGLKLADGADERKVLLSDGVVFCIVAAISEFVGVVGLKKYSERKPFINSILFVGGFGAAFVFLYISFNYFQVSTAYAVWIGIGTAGAVLINMLFFGESKNPRRIASLMLIVIGVVGLKALS